MKWNLPSCNKPLKCRLKNINPGTYFLNFTILQYRIIPTISPGAYIIPRPFWGSYFRKGLSMERNLRFKLDWASLIVGRTFTAFALFTLHLTSNFQVQATGGLYLEGRLNGGFFVLRVWGAYIWRGLYMKRLVFGILRYTAMGCTEVCWLLLHVHALSLTT